MNQLTKALSDAVNSLAIGVAWAGAQCADDRQWVLQRAGLERADLAASALCGNILPRRAIAQPLL